MQKVWIVMRRSGEGAFETTDEILHVCLSLDLALQRMGECTEWLDSIEHSRMYDEPDHVKAEVGKWFYEYWIDERLLEEKP